MRSCNCIYLQRLHSSPAHQRALLAVQRSGHPKRVAASTGSACESMSSSDLEGSEVGSGKLKMLCLHGFMQTGELFRMRIGSLRKALKSRVEFVFIDAPFLASDTLSQAQINEVGGSASGRTWFKWSDQQPGKRPSQSAEYHDFDTTYAHMAAALKEHAPDGVFGFSQGATAAALLMAQLLRRHGQGLDLDVPVPEFGVLCAGFLPRDPVYANLLSEERCSIPSLFILGDSDTLVPPERTLALFDTFDPATAQLLRHPGAHMVPTCSGDVKRQMVEFLDRFSPAADGTRTPAPGSMSKAASAAALAPEGGEAGAGAAVTVVAGVADAAGADGSGREGLEEAVVQAEEAAVVA